MITDLDETLHFATVKRHYRRDISFAETSFDSKSNGGGCGFGSPLFFSGNSFTRLQFWTRYQNEGLVYEILYLARFDVLIFTRNCYSSMLQNFRPKSSSFANTFLFSSQLWREMAFIPHSHIIG